MLNRERLIQKADKCYDLAIEAYETQRYAIAQNYLNQCLEINPEDDEAWTLLALRFFEMSYKKQKDDPDLYYYWGIALANTGEIKKALEKWNVTSEMYNPRLEDYIFRAREILAGKREYTRFEYMAG